MTALDNIKAALEAGPRSRTALEVWRATQPYQGATEKQERAFLAGYKEGRDAAIRELLAYVESLEAKTQAAEKALNQCASWNEGPEVGSHFDEPGAASIAREYFAAMEQTK